jgi:hypothetical protein
MFIRVLRNVAIFVALDTVLYAASSRRLDLVSIATGITIGFIGLFRPAELVLLVLLAFKARGSAGRKVQAAAIAVITLGYLLSIDPLWAKGIWAVIGVWMAYDWWTIPVARSGDQPDNEASA